MISSERRRGDGSQVEGLEAARVRERGSSQIATYNASVDVLAVNSTNNTTTSELPGHDGKEKRR
jgi:hypothetical protein